MRRLCTICARGGSKGVENKNIRAIGGKPLIAYSLEQARQSELFATIAVSSDSHEILDIAKIFGADILISRPMAMATDTAPKIDAIRHCANAVAELEGGSFDTIVDLDATSPLRVSRDIVAAVELLEEKGISNVITAAPARRSPYFNLVELGPDGVVQLSKSLEKQVVRRQDAPAAYDMNASIYVWKWPALFSDPPLFQSDTGLYVMPEERSLDIDSELDFRIVEFLITGRCA